MGLTHLTIHVANPARPEGILPVEFLVDSGVVYSVVPATTLRNAGGGVDRWDLMTISDIDIIDVIRHHVDMRTTLSIDDDIMAIVTRQAKLRGQSLGKTVSELVRRGLSAPTPSQDKDGLVVFQLPADSPTVTTEDVRRIEAEGA